MKKILNILILFGAISFSSGAQDYRWGNMCTLGSKGNEHIKSMTSTPDNFLWLTGTIRCKDTTFCEALGIETYGSNDILILKANSSGEIENTFVYGGKGNDNASRIVSNEKGQLFLCGAFEDSLQLGEELLKGDGQNLFVARIGMSGKVEKVISYQVGNGAFNALYADTTGVYVAGSVNGYLKGNGMEQKSTQKGDLLVLKLDTALNHVWGTVVEGPDEDYAADITKGMNGNLNVGAVVSPGFKLNNLALSPDTLADGYFSAIIVELDSIGQVKSAKHITDAYRLMIEDLHQVDSVLWLACKVKSDYTIGDSTYASTGGYDVFLERLLGDSLLMHQHFNGNNSDHIMGIRSIGDEVFVAGASYGDLVIGVDSLERDSLAGSTFLANYLSDGTFMGVSALAQFGRDYPGDLTISPSGDIYMSGNFRDDIQYRGSLVKNKGKEDLYLVKLVNCGVLDMEILGDSILCEGTTNTLNVNGRYESYFWNNDFYGENILEVSEPGLYTLLVRDTLGCELEDTFKVISAVNPEPDLGDPFGLFAGDTAILTPGVFEKYTWQDASGDSIFKLAGNDIFDSTLVKVIVENQYTCVAKDSVWVSAGQYLVDELTDIIGYPTQTDGLVYLENTGTNQYKLHIRVLTSDKKGIIYDSWSTMLPGDKVNIDLSEHPAGSYHVNIYHGSAYKGISFLKR